jgi:predicted nucleic acid-binding protein
MNAEAFLDTNVLVYAFDHDDPAKRERARELLADEAWAVSWQVVQEFAHVALHRFAVPIRPADLAEYLRLVLWPRCIVLPSLELHRAALELHRQTRHRFYDSLVLASAMASGAPVLYSEDLEDGRRFGHLEIRNPFAS